MEMKYGKELKRAIELLDEKQCSFVAMKEEKLIKISDEIGIKPIMGILREDRMGLSQCVVADKVIGKAAALMMVLGNVQAVYGRLMSEPAKEVLNNNDIECCYSELVPFIKNRTNTGSCPLEQAVERVDNPEIAFCELEETIVQLMKNKSV